MEISKELQKIKEQYSKVDFQNLELLETLGETDNGFIFKAFDKKSNEILAVKYLKIENISNNLWDENESIWEMMNEKNLLEKLSNIEDSPFLLLKSIVENEDTNDNFNQKSFLFITEYGRASLDQILKFKQSYDENEIAFILYKIVSGLFKGFFIYLILLFLILNS